MAHHHFLESFNLVLTVDLHDLIFWHWQQTYIYIHWPPHYRRKCHIPTGPVSFIDRNLCYVWPTPNVKVCNFGWCFHFLSIRIIIQFICKWKLSFGVENWKLKQELSLKYLNEGQWLNLSCQYMKPIPNS